MTHYFLTIFWVNFILSSWAMTEETDMLQPVDEDLLPADYHPSWIHEGRFDFDEPDEHFGLTLDELAEANAVHLSEETHPEPLKPKPPIENTEMDLSEPLENRITKLSEQMSKELAKLRADVPYLQILAERKPTPRQRFIRSFFALAQRFEESSSAYDLMMISHPSETDTETSKAREIVNLLSHFGEHEMLERYKRSKVIAQLLFGSSPLTFASLLARLNSFESVSQILKRELQSETSKVNHLHSATVELGLIQSSLLPEFKTLVDIQASHVVDISRSVITVSDVIDCPLSTLQSRIKQKQRQLRKNTGGDDQSVSEHHVELRQLRQFHSLVEELRTNLTVAHKVARRMVTRVRLDGQQFKASYQSAYNVLKYSRKLDIALLLWCGSLGRIPRNVSNDGSFCVSNSNQIHQDVMLRLNQIATSMVGLSLLELCMLLACFTLPILLIRLLSVWLLLPVSEFFIHRRHNRVRRVYRTLYLVLNSRAFSGLLMRFTFALLFGLSVMNMMTYLAFKWPLATTLSSTSFAIEYQLSASQRLWLFGVVFISIVSIVL